MQKFYKITAKGFTLIELSIVLVIISLLMSAGLAGMKVMTQNKKQEQTRANLANAEEKLKSYLALNRAYPCPASYAVKRSEEQFGKALEECITPADEEVDEHDIEKEFEAETITAEGRDKRRVRIGILPFRSLGLPDSEAVDGWGRLLQYAITERMTDKKSMNQRKGAIDVIAEDKKSKLTPPGSAQYVIFSTGEDGAAGYTTDGIRFGACPADVLQTENCDGDAVFMEAPKQFLSSEEKKSTKRKSDSPISYDDFVAYEQYDAKAGAGSGGLLYLYSQTCMEGFEEIPMPINVETADVERLSKIPSGNPAQMQEDMKEDVLCFSSHYSKALTVWTDKKVQGTICPEGWTNIGYRAIPMATQITYEVCAR